jgi:Na+-driven multidrug efflux pump
MAHGGEAAVHRVVVQGTMWVGMAMAAFCGVMLIWGDRVVGLLYGDAYAGRGPVTQALAVAVLLSGLGLAATHGLAAMQRSDMIFRARFLGLLTVLVASLVLVRPLGVLGAAYAYLAGSAVDAAAMYAGYRSRKAAERGTSDGGRVAGDGTSEKGRRGEEEKRRGGDAAAPFSPSPLLPCFPSLSTSRIPHPPSQADVEAVP